MGISLVTASRNLIQIIFVGLIRELQGGLVGTKFKGDSKVTMRKKDLTSSIPTM